MYKKRIISIFLSATLCFGSIISSSPALKQEKKAKATEKIQSESNVTTETKTETTTIKNLGNGKKKAEIYSRPVRFKDKNGKLKDYDTSLEKIRNTKGYVYETKETDKKLYFQKI